MFGAAAVMAATSVVAGAMAEEKAWEESVKHLPDSERSQLRDQRNMARSIAASRQSQEPEPCNSALAFFIGLLVGGK
jgi:hypothetical protein